MIEDIAHALSLQCRFNGHCSDFYSVAEHSLRVSRLVEWLGNTRDVVMTALLHDAAEAYIGDIVSPLKKELPDFTSIERVVESAIAERFSLLYPFPEVVHRIDKEVLSLEFATLRPFCEEDKAKTCLSPKEAEEEFLAAYRRLSVIDE